MKTFITLLLLSTLSYGQHIKADKKMHFAAGAAISAFTYGAVALSTKSKTKALIYSVGVGAAFGLAKEVYDSRKGGSGFDNADLVATVLGSVSVGVTLNVFTGKKKNKYRY